MFHSPVRLRPDKVLPAFLLGLSLVGCLSLLSVHGDAGASQTSKVRALQEQRLAALRRLVTATTESYKSGHASFDDLSSATTARDEAELELCTSNPERVVVLQRGVAAAKVLEEQEAKLAALKMAPETVLLKATANRLRLEIILEQTRAR